jgi:hypothetical protein
MLLGHPARKGDWIMLKVIVGSAIGGLVAGGIALIAAGQVSGRAVPPAPAPYGTPVPAISQPMAPTVACAPHQEATVARVIVNGSEAVTLTCVDRAPQGYVTYPQAGLVPQARLVSMTDAAVPVETVPVRTVPSAPARPARQVVYRDADDDVVRYEPDVRRDKRSMAKTAMIIGGSAGAGAGVGAIVGGKKGALIGAALGGGAASIYEATKR